MMRTWTVAKREIYATFLSPMAYVILTAWTLLSGLTFGMLVESAASQPPGGIQDNPMTGFFGATVLFYLPIFVFVPLITMRLLAEERSRGSIELLMTAPITDASIVLGKYIAALVFWVALWLPSTLYLWNTSRFGDLDFGQFGAAYLGVLGIGAGYMGIGLLMSAIAKNQIVAAVLTFLTICGLFIMGFGEYVFGPETREAFAYISVWGHMEAFSHGIVDSRYLVFDLSLALVSVVLTIGVLRVRRVEG